MAGCTAHPVTDSQQNIHWSHKYRVITVIVGADSTLTRTNPLSGPIPLPPHPDLCAFIVSLSVCMFVGMGSRPPFYGM